MQGKCREFLGNRALLAEDGPRFSSPTAGLAKNSLRPGTGNLLARTGNLFRGAGNSWEAMPASKARRLGQPIRLRTRARDEHSAHLGGSGCVASRRFHFGFHSAEFWHTTGSHPVSIGARDGMVTAHRSPKSVVSFQGVAVATLNVQNVRGRSCPVNRSTTDTTIINEVLDSFIGISIT